MGLYKTTPTLSGRMASLWCLSDIKGSAVIEYGCMGHMEYGRTFLHRMGSNGSRLYSTHISETDIAMGDMKRLSDAVKEISGIPDIRVIFLLPSSVPEVTGTDLKAAGKILQSDFTGVRIMTADTGGFDQTGSKGVERTLLQIAMDLSGPSEPGRDLTFNLIGACPDLLRFKPDAAEMKRIAEGAFHAKMQCCMTADTDIGELETMSAAHFNLVMRQEGEAAARYLEGKYGIPYVMARPYGVAGTVRWAKHAADHLKIDLDESFLEAETKKAETLITPARIALRRFLHMHSDDDILILCGHNDVIKGISDFGRNELGFRRAECYCDDPALVTDGIPFLEEQTKYDLASRTAGFMLSSGELLRMSGHSSGLLSALPDDSWQNPYAEPLVGFRGAVSLTFMLANEMQKRRH